MKITFGSNYGGAGSEPWSAARPPQRQNGEGGQGETVCREASLKWPQKVAATVRAATLRPCLQGGRGSLSALGFFPFSHPVGCWLHLKANEMNGEGMKFRWGGGWTETINS